MDAICTSEFRSNVTNSGFAGVEICSRSSSQQGRAQQRSRIHIQIDGGVGVRRRIDAGAMG